MPTPPPTPDDDAARGAQEQAKFDEITRGPDRGTLTGHGVHAGTRPDRRGGRRWWAQVVLVLAAAALIPSLPWAGLVIIAVVVLVETVAARRRPHRVPRSG